MAIVRFARLDKLYDVGVIQLSQQARFPFEASDLFLVIAPATGKHLERHRGTIGFMGGAKHKPHAARTRERPHLVATDGRQAGIKHFQQIVATIVFH